MSLNTFVHTLALLINLTRAQAVSLRQSAPVRTCTAIGKGGLRLGLKHWRHARRQGHPVGIAVEQALTLVGLITAAGALAGLLGVGVLGVNADDFVLLWWASALAFTPLMPPLSRWLAPLFWQQPAKKKAPPVASPLWKNWTPVSIQMTCATLLLSFSMVALADAPSDASAPPEPPSKEEAVDEAFLCACLSISDIPWMDAVVLRGIHDNSVG